MEISRTCPYCMEQYIDIRIAPTEENKEIIDTLVNRESVEKVCKTCTELIKTNVIFLTYSKILHPEGMEPEIVRSLGFIAMKDEGVKLLLKDFPKYLEQALESRVVYISDDQAINFGFHEYLNKTKDEQVQK